MLLSKVFLISATAKILESVDVRYRAEMEVNSMDWSLLRQEVLDWRQAFTWRGYLVSFLRRMPKFTFSHFTRDPNLHNPHLHKTQIYTTPNLHRTQIYMPLDLHHLKFTKPRFTQTQIYTASNIHKTQISTVPILHRPQFYNTKICIKSSPTFLSKGKTSLICTTCYYGRPA